MAVPFWTNSWLSNSMPDDGKQVAVHLRSTGALVANYPSSTTPSTHVRTGPTTNRRRFIPGTFTPWIPPSSYLRYAWIYERSSGTCLTTSQYEVRDSPIHATRMATSYGSSDKSNVLFSNGLYNPLNRNHPDVVNIASMATTKALLDYADAKSGMGENLATATQTANSLVDSIVGVTKAVRALKRGRWGAISKHLNVKALKQAAKSGAISKRLANQWLEYWFGWRPLAMDAYGLYELMQEHLEPALLIHGRGQGKMVDETFSRGLDSLNVLYCPPLVFSENWDVRARTNITGRIDPDGIILRSLNRLGLINPVSVAWELVPFSFAFDWVVPLGDVAEALTATVGTNFVGGHTTIRWERDIVASPKPAYLKGSPPVTKVQQFGFERTKLGGFPRPSPYVKPFYTGASRWATIAALLRQIKD